MEIGERDPVTGQVTTGHEWNGIKELYTPIPRIVFFFLATTILFAVCYWVLMPAWPLGKTYTKGLLGIDQKTSVERLVKDATLERSAWTQKIDQTDFAAIQADPSMMTIVEETGHTLFGDNCAACHGTKAMGGPGFPNLTAGIWLWGGDPETIFEPLRVGINSTHPDTRTSQMLAFGRALMSRPRLILMDEPSMGLAPALVQQNFTIIKEVHESGVAILMVEQNATMALSIADRGYVLATGEIALSGSAESLLRSDDLKRAYLGR